MVWQRAPCCCQKSPGRDIEAAAINFKIIIEQLADGVRLVLFSGCTVLPDRLRHGLKCLTAVLIKGKGSGQPLLAGGSGIIRRIIPAKAFKEPLLDRRGVLPKRASISGQPLNLAT